MQPLDCILCQGFCVGQMRGTFVCDDSLLPHYLSFVASYNLIIVKFHGRVGKQFWCLQRIIPSMVEPPSMNMQCSHERGGTYVQYTCSYHFYPFTVGSIIAESLNLKTIMEWRPGLNSSLITFWELHIFGRGGSVNLGTVWLGLEMSEHKTLIST